MPKDNGLNKIHEIDNQQTSAKTVAGKNESIPEQTLTGGMLREANIDKMEKTKSIINAKDTAKKRKGKGKKKKTIKNPILRFFYNLFFAETLLKIISVVVAFLIWMSVAYFVSPNINKIITDVAVAIDLSETATGKLGLNIFSMDKNKVAVLVKGQRSNVGSLTNEAIKISAQLSTITEPGVYNVKLEASPQGPNTNFEIISITPQYISMRFDNIVKKVIPVVVDNSGVVIMQGLIGTEPVPAVKEITIKGPETEISRVSSATVSIATETPLTNSTSIIGAIQLKDASNNNINADLITLEKNELSVLVPVYKIKDIPLSVEFINLPPNIVAAEIPYTMGHKSIQVAGPPDKIDAMTEIKLGSVNINDWAPGTIKEFKLELPTGYISLDNIEKVDFTFDSPLFTTKTVSVKKFNVLNTPPGKTATIATKILYNVTLVGTPDALSAVTDTDIVCEIDLLTTDLENGQWNFPVTVKVVDKGLVWAIGSYKVDVKIT